MRRLPLLTGIVVLGMVAVARAQAPGPQPAPEMRDWDLWVGDWTMVGKARDSVNGPEYDLEWRLHGRRMLGGFFIGVNHVWKGLGPEMHSHEILSYDPIRRVHAFTGYSSDGTMWVATATFEGGRSVETGRTTTSDGQIITWRNTWTVSADRMAISGVQDCERGRARWVCFTVRGTRRAATPGR